jgi:transposase
VDGSSSIDIPLQLGTPRDLVGLLLCAPETLTAPKQRELMHILQDRQINVLYELGQQFQLLLRRREPAGLEPWLTTAMASSVPELHAFAVALHQDRDAVQAALREDWSNGQVEGQITRIKSIKRRMYGRANFDLLRQHILWCDEG